MQRRLVETLRKQPVILLTGFGPFPGVDDNITARLVPELAEHARRQHRHITVIGAVLPTEWQNAPHSIDDLIRTHKPSVALHFGVAREANGFRLEGRAANACRHAADAMGCMPAAAKLIDNGPEYRHATLPADAILKRLQDNGLPASLSSDAGNYLCNAVLYHSLATTAASNHRCLSGFVHLPADLTALNLSYADAMRGANLIIDSLIETLSLSR